ncbi:MAG: hypothetical protein WED05_01570 [Candidatus Atabeyarchaeum deiterrae]
MSEFSVDSVMTWYDEKTKELSADFASEVNRRLDKIRGAIKDIGLVLHQMGTLKPTEQDEIVKASLDRFIEKIMSTTEQIAFPDDLTYSIVGEFLSRLERSVTEIYDAGRRWIPKFRGRQYKSVLIDLDKHFRDLTKETHTLDNICKNYRHLTVVERVREDIGELKEMLTRIPEVNDEIEEKQKKLGSAEKSVRANESRIKEYKSRTGVHEKEEIDRELDGIRQTLTSQLDLLRKAMSKLRDSAEGGSVHIKPEDITTIELYSRDLPEALNSEPDGCPGLKDLLSSMRHNIDSLGLEGSKKRRTLKRIESLLESDLLPPVQKRVKQLLQRKSELLQSYKPDEEERLATELEESKKHLRDEETRTHRSEEELAQLNSKLKDKAKAITSEIAKLTGQKIHISLKS